MMVVPDVSAELQSGGEALVLLGHLVLDLVIEQVLQAVEGRVQYFFYCSVLWVPSTPHQVPEPCSIVLIRDLSMFSSARMILCLKGFVLFRQIRG